jgi:TonB family protein
VRLALFIDETGLVRKLRVVASMPENMFDSAAVRAWQDVRFSPAMKDGGPVKSRKVLDVEFTPD